MSRSIVRLEINDLSQFSKNISRQWPDEKPSHLSLMNLIARSAGYQNFQHLKSAQTEQGGQTPERSADEKRWFRLLSDQGTLMRWPTKRKDQLALLWFLYERLPQFKDWKQNQLDAWIDDRIAFGDKVLVRREMVELGMINRTRDGRSYWMEQVAMPDQYRAFATQPC